MESGAYLFVDDNTLVLAHSSCITKITPHLCRLTLAQVADVFSHSTREDNNDWSGFLCIERQKDLSGNCLNFSKFLKADHLCKLTPP